LPLSIHLQFVYQSNIYSLLNDGVNLGVFDFVNTTKSTSCEFYIVDTVKLWFYQKISIPELQSMLPISSG
jgi:hypothetical protein